jgi:hypothetical protein
MSVGKQSRLSVAHSIIATNGRKLNHWAIGIKDNRWQVWVGQQMFRRILLLLFIAKMTVGVSIAQQSKDGTYSCAAETSGGIFYNNQTKKWEGTGFRPLSRFVLSVKYVRTTTDVDEYAVTVMADGSGDALACTADRTPLVQFDEVDFLICRTKFYNYKFNLKAGRFVEAYLMGYVNGRNTNEDTPVLSGGVCKKIE